MKYDIVEIKEKLKKIETYCQDRQSELQILQLKVSINILEKLESTYE